MLTEELQEAQTINNISLSLRELAAFNRLVEAAQTDNGCIEVHPHNKDQWGDYLVFKSLCRKGLAECDYSDASCLAGWVAEFYEKEYYAEVGSYGETRLAGFKEN